MDKKRQTIETYDSAAERMAEKFNGVGARTSDIEETFRLLSKENPATLEIGCGNGRDAAEILKHTNDYLGIDIAERFIELAKRTAPKGRFEVADIESFAFPQGLDAIFAFASLIHVPKESLAKVIESARAALNPGGVIRISMKFSEVYKEVIKEDEFGVRTYYLYSQEDMRQMLKSFNLVKDIKNELRGQTWIEILARKSQ
ncbi:MAG TPA: class I SAM-dependent methyltransferase [Candidatus Paceibacterota bacterium]|nr:class I SAM-dependent methyltransferase [Candidatus Paceibacterota bacterium]